MRCFVDIERLPDLPLARDLFRRRHWRQTGIATRSRQTFLFLFLLLKNIPLLCENDGNLCKRHSTARNVVFLTSLEKINRREYRRNIKRLKRAFSAALNFSAMSIWIMRPWYGIKSVWVKFQRVMKYFRCDNLIKEITWESLALAQLVMWSESRDFYYAAIKTTTAKPLNLSDISFWFSTGHAIVSAIKSIL